MKNLKKYMGGLALLAMALCALPTSSYAQGKGKKTVKSATMPPKDDGGFTQTVDNSQIKWKSLVWDFGDVEYGSNVRHEFQFKNTGGTPITVYGVKAGCGCTTTSYTQEMVPSGGVGQVTAKYDSSIIGNFSKTVTVNFGGQQFVLTIKGNVVSPKGSMP